MASREKIRQIDAQLQALQPGWGEKDYDGERKMLYDMMGDDEHIERLSAGGWKVLQRGRAMESHDRGIFAATGRGVVFLNKGRLSNNAAKIPYLAILEVQQQGPGELTVVTPLNHYSLSLDPGAAGLADFIRGRLLSDAASLEDSLSDILIGGERIDHWARGKAGEEWVNEVSNPAQAGGDRYHHTDFLDTESLAVATDRRILFCTLEIGYEREYIDCPHGSILSVGYRGGRRIRFVDVDAKVRTLRFQQEADATQFVKLMREHVGTAARRVSAEARISAEWKLQHPLWDHRKNHGGERRKLAEIMDDDEHIEGLAWGDYHPAGSEELLYGGIIAATERRLLVVSNGLLEKNVSQLPYDGIDGVALKDGDLIITAKPGHSGYVISSIDDMDPHDSRRKGHRDAFAARLQTIVESAPNLAPAPATPAQESEPEAPVASRQADKPQAAPDLAKQLRIDSQWTERSADDWNIEHFENARKKLYEVLEDEEDIEFLINGDCIPVDEGRNKIPGGVKKWGVIAATGRRLVYVYISKEGELLSELSYNNIESVHLKKGLLSSTIWIATRSGDNGWKLGAVLKGEGSRFVERVRSLLAHSV